MEKKYEDNLTKIGNRQYLMDMYSNYLEKNPSSYFVMLDIEKFKTINDCYGHKTGNDYLILLAKTLENNFSNSLVCRVHGDEFIIVTNKSQIEVENCFNRCIESLNKSTKELELPAPLKFNAGSTIAAKNITKSLTEADYIMYLAKQNKEVYRHYNPKYVDMMNSENKFKEDIKQAIEENKIIYTKKSLYNINEEESNIYELSPQKSLNEQLVDEKNYNVLKATTLLYKYDFYNLQNLLKNSNSNNKKSMMIDYKTVISPGFIEFLGKVEEKVKNIILSININNLEFKDYDTLIERIILLKKHGFLIQLDKYDSKVANYLLENTEVEYIKFLDKYWHKSLELEKPHKLLHNHIATMSELEIIPVFDAVQTKKEFELLKNFDNNDMLLGGNYFESSKKLILKK